MTKVFSNQDMLPMQILTSDSLKTHHASKHHFTSLKTDLIFLWLEVLEGKFRWWECCTNTWQFSLMYHPLQVIFTYYKSWIAVAIRGLLWVKITMANSGLNVIELTFYPQKVVPCNHANATHNLKWVKITHYICTFWIKIYWYANFKNEVFISHTNFLF